MKKRYSIPLTLIAIVLLGAIMFEFKFKATDPLSDQSTIKDKVLSSKQFDGKKFQNTVESNLVTSFWKMMKMYLFEKQKPASPIKPIEVKAITKDQLIALQNDPKNKEDLIFFRLGHSTILILLNGEFWMTDPVFSKRASPFGFAGPKRFHEPPITIDELPQIKGVVISHNHYDHLDKWAIKQLIGKVEHFYTPLGVGEDLIAWGVDKKDVTQMDWWESVNVAGVEITSTPARHFSGRGMGDGNSTFWSGWSLKSKTHSLFYTGDTGYFDGFKQIGERLGPFDVSFVETGAYNKLWPDIHMMPEQSAQAHLDAKAKIMMPIHNGTFDLALHKWTDPFEQMVEIAKSENIQLLTPKMGHLNSINQLKKDGVVVDKWWLE